MSDPIKVLCDVCGRGRREVHEPMEWTEPIMWGSTQELSSEAEERMREKMRMQRAMTHGYYCTRCGTVKFWPKGIPE